MPNADRSSPEPLSPVEIVTGSLAFVSLAITAWAFAGRAAWAPATFTSLSAATACAAIGLSLRDRRPFDWLEFLPFLLFSAYLGLSLLNPSHQPLPDRPGSWIPNENWIRWLPTTLDRDTTLTRMLPWVSALLLGGALRQARFSRRASRLFWGLLLAHGLLLAVAGLYFHAAHPHQILGLIRDRHGYHFSSFVYRNHWAAYQLVLVPLALGFAFSALGRWTARRGRLDAVLPGLGAALLLTLTVPIPGSRSGTVILTLVLLCALARIAWVIGRTRDAASPRARWWRLAPLLGFSGLVILGGLMLGQSSLRQHWQRTQAQARSLASGHPELRLQLTRDTLRMAADRPIWGWGIGSYGNVFHVYQGDYLRDADGRINARVIHAHNDWAHLAAELGLLGLPLLLVPMAVRYRAAWRAPGALAKWAAIGLGIVLVYALVDFPFHNPALLLLWTAILCTTPPPLLPIRENK